MKRIQAIIIVSFILLLGLVEVGLRLHIAPFLETVPYESSSIEGVPYIQFDPNSINLDKTKPRIIAIGDYITAHKSFTEDKDYTQVLEEKLNYSYEIINTGASYYSIPEEINLLQNWALNNNPDIIIIGYIFNDIYYENSIDGARPVKIKTNLNKFTILSPMIIEQIKYNQKWEGQEKISIVYANKNIWLDSYYNRHIDSDRYINYLTQLEIVQTQSNVPIIFVIIPIFIDFNDDRQIELNQNAFELCLDFNLTCISMYDIYKEYGVTEVKEDDQDIWHPNDLGIELIADAIYQQILHQ